MSPPEEGEERTNEKLRPAKGRLAVTMDAFA
jgi:hypothetical protein